MLRILLADDHPIISGPLAEVLAREPDFYIVGSVNRQQQIWEQLQQNPVDVLLLDLYISPDIRDLSLARQIRQQYPALKIVLLTGITTNARLIDEANKMGLAGYLSKSISVDELIYELRKVAQGKRAFSSEILTILLSGQLNLLPELTPRETAILDLLKLGMKRDAICRELEFKAKSTYDTHLQHLKDKFSASSTNELLRKAAELGYD